jgi:hypothetical protein
MPKLAEKPFEVHVSSRYGAPMGRRQDKPSDFEGKVYLQKVPMVDGDYDSGGAYWGGNDVPLFCAWDDHGHALYIRAKDKGIAKLKLPSHWKYATKGQSSRNSIYAEEMLQQYMETALWSSTDMDTEEPLDRNYGTSDIAEKTKEGMLKDCSDFYDANHKILDEQWPPDAAGHEFWLNRNGHGAGFWDSKHGDDKSRRKLADAARVYGAVYLYPGDDGLIYSN